MGAEDFAFYSQKIPACFYRLGVQNPNGTGLHTPNFDVDEKSLEVGVGLMSWLAMQD
jgi:metal-dependent amidase/aminoacylase/carboxypeptidase family protein